MSRPHPPLAATLPLLACLAASGCSCGARALPVADGDGGADAAAPPRSCAPQAVHETFCAQCGSGRPRVFWDGVGCFEMDTCTCDGDGCAESFASVAECLAAMAGCDSSRCQATGGLWIPATPCGPCGHYVCGEPTGARCCDAGCDCGPGRTFVAELGCQPDYSCTRAQLCRASGGAWHPATLRCISCGDWVCGQAPSGEDCCVTGCDCGPHRNYVAGAGCQADPACQATREEQCSATGGAVDPACVEYVCGERSALGACDQSGCDCGPQGVWDEADGCVVGAECLTRQAGESCSGWAEDSNCRPGLVCCAQCGVPDGCMICQMPEPCCHPDDPGCGAACPPAPV